MALADRLLNELRATVVGSSDAMLGSVLWNVINDACRNGHIWRETVPITLTAGISAYTVAPAGTEVVHVFSVSHATIDFNVNTAVYEYGIVTLTTAPSAAEAAAGPMYVVAALTPALSVANLTAEQIEALVPVDMWSTHHELFKSGVLARLLGQPSKPYTNPQLAAYYLRKFDDELATAKRIVETGGLAGAQLWRFPKWAPQARR